ncbi:MAG: hypothetical protein HOE80_03045 [Candidatus Magasanikbacteria bacterium]|jgi:hypothetical protein|nr:hypothetical protein [Candidatus Magasanikbacteria bacterium]MBT4071676.1 hypothetical protein [Candidatus Magasanikbacteria bacterium]
MIQRIIKFLAIFALLFVVVTIHLGIAYMLPFPWNSLNILFVFSILFLVFRGSGLVIWITCVMHFFVELYSAQPFGIAMVSSTFSLLFTYWLYQYIFTNRSWYIVIILSISSLFFYRVMSTILLWLFSIFINDIELPLSSLMIQYGWEMFCTTVVASMLYIIPYMMKPREQRPKKALFL